jgi:uncharacterized membrane protein
MKKVFILIGVFVLGLTLTYLLFAFVNWQTHPLMWGEESRVLSVLVSIVIAFLPTAFVTEYLLSKKNNNNAKPKN